MKLQLLFVFALSSLLLLATCQQKKDDSAPRTNNSSTESVMTATETNLPPTQSPTLETVDEGVLGFVIIDTTEEAYTVYIGIPATITEEEIKEVQETIKDDENVSLIEWEAFRNEMNQYVIAKIIKDEYDAARVAQGLASAIQKFPSTPFGLTWNGGIAFTYNDYNYVERMYKSYQEDPTAYEAGRPQDRASDPIHPENHFGPLLGQ